MTDGVPAGSDAVGEGMAPDRRRPERMEHVSPSLIPLMRSEDVLAASQPWAALDSGRSHMGDADDGLSEGDQLRSVRGILFGILLSLPFWVAILAALR